MKSPLGLALLGLVALSALWTGCTSVVHGKSEQPATQDNTLSLAAPIIDRQTGTVMINGGDTRQPTTAFTWNWGDGVTGEAFFPASHTYADKTRNYTVEITAHYADGRTAKTSAVVSFQ